MIKKQGSGYPVFLYKITFTVVGSKDIIPTYDKNQKQEFEFSGKRVKRGLYRTAKGYTFNADCNGALNILSKSNRVSLTALSDRGELDTPVRIRVV